MNPQLFENFYTLRNKMAFFIARRFFPVLPIAEQNSRDFIKRICIYIYLFHDLGGPRWHSG